VHIVSIEGIEVDPEKIETIIGWSMIKNVIEIRSFMGFLVITEDS
jgi:hypothetical protein